ncbi:MAG TPA: hypothetical protein VLI67_10380 [Vicinamibacteria bacterium]|nr:hypothetical protein [Vicinamibacteria bacterium]
MRERSELRRRWSRWPWAALATAGSLFACGGDGGPEAFRWRAAERISGGPGDALAPDAAMDASGNAVAVWHQDAPEGRSRVWAARQPRGGPWEAPVALDPGEAEFARFPRVAVDPAGNAVAVWSRIEGSPAVWASRFLAGRGWSPPERLTAAGEPGWFPDLALDPGGDGIVVWQSDRPTGVTIRAARWAGGHWESPRTIQRPLPETGGSPRVAVAADGTAVAVWHELQAGTFRIWANRFRPGAGWATAEPISPPEAREGALFADVAMDALGNAVAVWQRWAAPGLWDVVAARLEPARGWGPATTVAASRPSGEFPRVAMDPGGNALAVWRDATGGSVFGVWAARFRRDRGWGQTVLLQSNVGTGADLPQVALDGTGNGLAAWRRPEADRVSIFAARFLDDAGWDVPLVVASGPRAGTDLGNVGPVALALGPGGGAVAAWAQGDAGGHAVWASRYGSVGP